MNMRELLGQNVHPDFIDGAETPYFIEFEMGRKDYPHFNGAYQYSAGYSNGYSSAYHDDIDAREQRRLEEQLHPKSFEIDRRNGL